MNYIFFDIECANCQNGQAKICSFGYVITDESFTVLEKEDWIVNPKAPFLLTGHRNVPYIQLAYDREEFRKAPDFPRVYGQIRDLLTRPDSLIFGYAADNDAGYLRSEYERYQLPCVDFTYYDLQKLLHFALPDAGPNQLSLQAATALFREEIHQDIHKSDEDAYLTMLVLEGLCRQTGLSPLKLLERYPVCRGDLLNNRITVRVLEGQNLLLKVLGDKTDRISPKSEHRTLYVRFIRHVKPSGREYPQWLKGKRVGVPEKYAERHYRDVLRLIQLICDCGGRYSSIPEDCHIFLDYPVYTPEGDRKVCAELQRLFSKHPSRCPAVLQPEEFFSFCGLTEEAFSALPLPQVEYLLDERYAPPPKTEKEQKSPLSKRQRRRKPKKERETVVIIPKEKG